MTLGKNCPCCKKPLTTKNTIFNGESDMAGRMLFFTCKDCKSTTVLISKEAKKQLEAAKQAA